MQGRRILNALKKFPSNFSTSSSSLFHKMIIAHGYQAALDQDTAISQRRIMQNMVRGLSVFGYACIAISMLAELLKGGRRA
jgi:hypothetical protein